MRLVQPGDLVIDQDFQLKIGFVVCIYKKKLHKNGEEIVFVDVLWDGKFLRKELPRYLQVVS